MKNYSEDRVVHQGQVMMRSVSSNALIHQKDGYAILKSGDLKDKGWVQVPILAVNKSNASSQHENHLIDSNN